MATVELELSRTFPVPVGEAFERLLVAPLEQVFSRRYGPLPPVRRVRDQAGAWGTPGQTRVIELADGATMREELTSVVADREFRYRITHLTGPMKALVGSLDGRWGFEAAGTGVRITWAWSVHPSGAVAGLGMPVFARLWRGYARQALEQVETLIV
jgi:hypothetical protein